MSHSPGRHGSTRPGKAPQLDKHVQLPLTEYGAGNATEKRVAPRFRWPAASSAPSHQRVSDTPTSTVSLQEPGTLGHDEFNSQCIDILRRARACGDERWEWVAGQSADEAGYLRVREVLRVIEPNVSTAGESEVTGVEAIEFGVDSDTPIADDDGDCIPFTPSDTNDRMRAFEYHVCYSVAYSVPVLYFQVRELDGSPVTGDAVWATLPRASGSAMHSEAAVSQGDHPVLQRPFFFLHPCRTAEVLQGAGATAPGRNTVLIWLSVMARDVGLDVSEQLVCV